MNIRVAIFEDNKLTRDAYQTILDGTPGFQCVGSFPDANELDFNIRKSTPDVILMDIELPGCNGIEATMYISQHNPSIKILIQTVFDDDDKIFSAICAGASGYLLKNYGLTRFLDAITEVYNGGSPMSPTIASRVLRLFQKFAPVIPDPQKENLQLSQREKEILSLMVEGHTFHTIAEMNFISYETVRTHVKKIYKKLHVASASEAVAKAIRQRII